MVSLLVQTIRLITAFFRGFKDPEFRGLLVLVVVLLLSGTIFYHRVEGWRLLDSLFFCVITLTSVGYGDFVPQTDTGKVFTMIYCFTVIGTLLGFLNSVSQYSRRKARKDP